MFDWLQNFADYLIYSVFSIEQHTKLGDALNFFVFDTLKIALLLFVITTIMGIVNSYFPGLLSEPPFRLPHTFVQRRKEGPWTW